MKNAAEAQFGVFGDAHSNIRFYGLVAWQLLRRFKRGDTIIANGDVLGSRGKYTSEIVSCFYDVKRGDQSVEALEKLLQKYDWEVSIDEDCVQKALHSGTFMAMLYRRYPGIRELVDKELRMNLKRLGRLSRLMKLLGMKFYYVPGNGELMFPDFDTTNGVEEEVLVPAKYRVCNKLAADGVFERLGVAYVTEPVLLSDDILLLPVDALDTGPKEVLKWYDVRLIKKIVVHYPPPNRGIEYLFRAYCGYKMSTLDVERCEQVRMVLEELPNLEKVYFGHIHVSPKQQIEYPIQFWNKYSFRINESGLMATWVRPGYVAKI